MSYGGAPDPGGFWIPGKAEKPKDVVIPSVVLERWLYEAISSMDDDTGYLVQDPDLHSWYDDYLTRRDQIRKDLRASALAKLTTEEKEALGLGNT